MYSTCEAISSITLARGPRRAGHRRVAHEDSETLWIVLDVTQKRERGLLEHEPRLLGVETIGDPVEQSLDLAVHDHRVQTRLPPKCS